MPLGDAIDLGFHGTGVGVDIDRDRSSCADSEPLVPDEAGNAYSFLYFLRNGFSDGDSGSKARRAGLSGAGEAPSESGSMRI